MFTEHNTNGQYTGKQIEWMNARLITLYPLADSPDDFEYDEQLVKHFSDRVIDEVTTKGANMEQVKEMKLSEVQGMLQAIAAAHLRVHLEYRCVVAGEKVVVTK